MRCTYIILALVLAPPGQLLAQVRDTNVWQDTGRDNFRDWARRDSATARAFFRNLQRGDYRFLNVPDYGDGAIGMYTPAHDSTVARYGVRMYADSDLTDETVRAQKYYNPYHFAQYYNRALFSYLRAPEAERRCYQSQSTPFRGCDWSPLPRSPTPPAERPLAPVDSASLAAMLDAALAAAITHSGSDSPVAIDAEYGWDGIYRPARKGAHPAGWLRSILRRHSVTCVLHWSESPPCPATGALTTVSLNQPRLEGDTTIVIHTTTYTVMDQQAPAESCGFGCFFGRDFDARLVREGPRYRAEPIAIGYMN